jgi:hypothetical protein
MPRWSRIFWNSAAAAPPCWQVVLLPRLARIDQPVSAAQNPTALQIQKGLRHLDGSSAEGTLEGKSPNGTTSHPSAILARHTHPPVGYFRRMTAAGKIAAGATGATQLWKSNAPDNALVSRVRANRVWPGIELHAVDADGSLFVRLLKPRECFVFLSEREIRRSDLVRANEASLNIGYTLADRTDS